MRHKIELGIIDSIWDASVHPYDEYIIIVTTSLEGQNNGWYRAYIDRATCIVEETRMLPEGNYDKEPATNRPPMRAIIAAIPQGNDAIVDVLRRAYEVADNG